MLILKLLVICLQAIVISAGQFFYDIENTNITVKWNADYDSQTVLFSVNLGNNPPKFFSLGFSDHGQMNKSDACVLQNGKLQDMYVTEEFDFIRDLRQDCELVRMKKNSFVFRRQFTTCDPMDYSLQTGTTQMIVAASWDNDINNMNDRRLFKEMRFAKVLGEDKEEKIQMESDAARFQVLADNAQVPAETTTYWCVIKPLPTEVQAKKHHIIQMSAVVQSGHEHLTHHMEVYLCLDDNMEAFSGNCNDPRKPKASKSCSHVVAAWAMGEGPIIYPMEAGLPIGGKGANRYLMVEIHYNNPAMTAGQIDSSGFEFVVTPTLRPNDAAIMELGLVYSDANSIPPGQSAFAINAHCPMECTSHLPQKGITIFASQLHAHLTGTKLWTSHYRNGVKIGEVNRDEHYSPHWQHLQPVRPYVRVMPGDTLTTTCVYETTRRAKTTFGGYSIEDEMCVNYIYYYPASEVEVCKSAVSNSTLRNYFKYSHNIDRAMEMPISEMYNSVSWDENKARELHDLFSVAPLNMNCLQRDGSLFPGRKWDNIAQPRRFSGTFIKTRDNFECPALND